MRYDGPWFIPARAADARIAALEARVAALTEALCDIEQWCSTISQPTSPNWVRNRARAVLGEQTP